MSKQENICSDNIAYLKTLRDNSVDAVVTDAPYGLGKEPNVTRMLQAWITVGYLEVPGSGFMNMRWDSFVPQPNFWKEVFRVLKPGGHILCFFGTRTYDWGVMAIRIAGFEIRDQLQWIFGSGFPKSLNVSKSIDEKMGAERKVIGKRTDGRYASMGTDIAGGNYMSGSPGKMEIGIITEPATDEAKQWEGWGSALKPANEPIVMARKPIEKGLTIVENVLKWGTGGINIDASRIKGEPPHHNYGRTSGSKSFVGESEGSFDTPNIGRFPANVLFDEEAAKLLDLQSGELTSGAMTKSYKYTNNGNSMGAPAGASKQIHESNSGFASRFFYVAKPSQAERNKGLENFENKKRDESREAGNVGGDNPRNRGVNEVQNFHPTVKPVLLMRYLVNMVTPIGGLCIDPFTGSGTTGIACILEDIGFTGVDSEQDYIDISNARMAAHNIPLDIQYDLFD